MNQARTARFLALASLLVTLVAGGAVIEHGLAVRVAYGSSKAKAAPSENISPDEAKRLLNDFSKAQKEETKSLERRQKSELKELKAAQKARLKDWKLKETESRKEYYAKNKGASVRDYMHDSNARYQGLMQMQKEEYFRQKREGDARLDAVKKDQQSRLKEFKEYLERGERPPGELWPTQKGK